MANTKGVADHKAANTTTIPGLTVERTKSIMLLLVQLFSVVQTGLSIAGISQLPFTSDQVSTAITGVIAVIASVYAWWRNNNVTEAAVQGQQLTTAIKNGTIAATQGTSLPPETTGLTQDVAGSNPASPTNKKAWNLNDSGLLLLSGR